MRYPKSMLVLILLVLSSAAYISASPQAGPAVKELRAVSGDITLFARVAGNLSSGNVLLTINGGPGLSSRYMTDLEAIAGPDLAVVTFDQRGVGRSAKPAMETAQFTMEKYAEDIEAVRKALKVKSFHVLGHSWGGMLAIKYAALHPGRVDSMILIGNGPLRDFQFTEIVAKIRTRVIELMKQGLIDPKLPRHSDIFPAYLSDPKFKPKMELISDLDEPVENITFEAIKGYDLRADAAKIKNPVLILWGRDDPVSLGIAEETKAALSQSRVELVIIEGCGHYWHEKPEPFYSRIRKFLGLRSGS